MTPEQLAAHRAYERGSQLRCSKTPGFRGKRYAEKIARRQAKLAIYREAKSQPCMDCGNRYHPECMDFDHLRDKSDNVSVMVYRDYSVAALLAEIEKCELVCANCHRTRTRIRREAGNT
jgi:L-lysine 2,3-aminomutase